MLELDAPLSMAEQMEEIIFSIIINAGECRACAFEALAYSQQGQAQEAQISIQQAQAALDQAHKTQTSLIHQEADGAEIDFSIVLIHSQDHLMTAISELELIKRQIPMNLKMLDLEKRLARLEA